MNCYCTIITSNYFFYAAGLYDSLKVNNAKIKFSVLIVDQIDNLLEYEDIQIFNLLDIKKAYASEYQIIEKYEEDKSSILRWALKPLFLKFLLLNELNNKVIFLDPDLYFYEDSSFLFDNFKEKDVIITPHWRSKNPTIDASNFNELFTGGLFNAGFFGCNSKAINILDWWLQACAYKMDKKDGYYVDQIYLNLMPIYFASQVEVIQHKGCNVANWNMVECKRTQADNSVKINNEFPIVFIHFTNGTINNIALGKDSILLPYLETYKDALLVHNSDFKFNYELVHSKNIKKRKNILKRILIKLFK